MQNINENEPIGLPREKLDEDRISRVDDFLSSKECKEYIQKAESNGFRPSPSSGGGHGRTGREEPRNNQFTIISDQKLADQLWIKIKGTIPSDLSFVETSPYFGSSGGSEWKACGIVERFYKYEIGQQYPEHMDGAYKRNVVTDSGENFTQQSFMTLLIYLNDDFEGGKTLFYPDHQHCRFLREIENKIPTLIVTPSKGSALISLHSILHSAEAVTSGVKYVLRTDILYQKKVPAHPKLNKFGNGEKKAASVSEWEKIFEPSCKLYHD